jgi:hypothetical protein
VPLGLEVGVLDLAQVVLGQLDLGGGDVLLEPVQLRRAGNRNDPRPLGEQPGDRDLRRRRVLAPGDLAREVDEGAVGPARIALEARILRVEVRLFEPGALVDRAGQGSPCRAG